MRLEHLLSQASGGPGGAQQRSVKESSLLVRAGRVSVAGVVVLDRSHQVLLHAEEVCVDGIVVDTTRVFDRLLLFHKPMGTVCASAATTERSIFNVLPAAQRHATLRFYGRLDRDTTGLMLLGTDGGLGHLLTSPDTHVDKEYWALLKSVANGGVPLADDAAAQLAAGVVLSDGVACRPATLEVQAWGCAGPRGSALRRALDTSTSGSAGSASTRSASCSSAAAATATATSGCAEQDVCRECGERGHWQRACPTLAAAAAEAQRIDATHRVEACVRLVLHEGKTHQAKKVLACVGGNIVRLHREAVGPLRLSELDPPIPAGTARAVTASERAVILGLLPVACRSAHARRALARGRKRGGGPTVDARGASRPRPTEPTGPPRQPANHSYS